MIPFSGPKVYAPQRGLAEYSIVCDNSSGAVGTSGIHYNRQFTDTLFVAAIPAAALVSVGGSGSYLSPIHGPSGSDVGTSKNNNTTPASSPRPNIPAFPNPEVTSYPVGSLEGDQLTNGYKNTEKNQRTVTDGNSIDGVNWVSTNGCDGLLFSLWLQSVNNPTTDMFKLEVYRDLHVLDKVAAWSGTAPGKNQNAQLIYEYGPTLSKPSSGDPAGSPSANHPNMQIAVPVKLPAGTNIYILVRNITTPGTANLIFGSVRLVAA